MNKVVLLTTNITYEDFLEDDMRLRATERYLEIVGEACKKLPDDFRITYFEIDWKGLAGLRDKLIHHYFGVDYELIWDITQNHIPDTAARLGQIIAIEQAKSNNFD